MIGRMRWGALLAVTACASAPVVAPQQAPPPEVAPASAAEQPIVESLQPDGGAATRGDPALVHWEGRKDLLTPPAPPVPRPLDLPAVDGFLLGNGLRVVILAGGGPRVHATLAVPAGVLSEPPVATGIARLTAALLREGTTRRSGAEIAILVEQMGGSLDVEVDADRATLDCDALAADLDRCLDVLSDVAMRPSFELPSVAGLSANMVAAANARTDNPAELGQEHLANLLFGDEHPLGKPTTPQGIERFTRKTVLDFWSAHYRPHNAVLVVTADARVSVIRDLVAHRFGEWKGEGVPVPTTFDVPERKGTRILLIDSPGQQRALIMLAQRTPARGDPDFPATALLTRILAGSDFASRLLVELAVRRRLSADVSASLDDGHNASWLRVGLSAPAPRAVEALLATVTQMRVLHQNGPREDELAAARGFVAGHYPLELESPASIAQAVARAVLDEKGVLKIGTWPVDLAAVTVDQARAAAARVLSPDALVVVMVGDAQVIGSQLRQSKIRFEQISRTDPVSVGERARRRQDEENAATGGDPGARAMLIRALHEQGGVQRFRALKKLKVVRRGVRKQGDNRIDMESTTHYDRPDRVRVHQVLKTPTQTAASFVEVAPDGVKGGPATDKLVPLPPENVQRIRASVFEDVNFLLINILDSKPALPMRVLVPMVEDGVGFPGITVRVPSGDWLRLYFDPNAHRLARIRTENPDGLDTEEQLSDYQDIGNGLLLPFRQASISDGSISTADIIEAKLE